MHNNMFTAAVNHGEGGGCINELFGEGGNIMSSRCNLS